MNPQTETSALVRKLVGTFHLNVPERAAFRGASVSGSLVKAAVLALLLENGAYPPQWRDSPAYDGGLVLLGDDGSCSVTWMGEVGIGRFEVVDRERFESAAEAVAAYAPRFFGRAIDGI